ncbi:MAG TPA: hypothetical protein VGH67_17455 [Solirubrobacteraceae bacterium]
MGLSALVATALALGAAACGSSSSGGGGTQSASSSAGSAAPASTATSSAAAAATSSAAPTPSAASAGGSTAAPGATFKAGQTARVGFNTTTKSGKQGPSYKLGVNVMSITKGSLADFNGIKLDASEKASTPYYVKVKITSLGPGRMATTSNDPAISVEGVDRTGETQQSVTFFGDFPKCDEAQTPNPLGVGKSFQTCLTFLVPGGITKVAYTGTESYITKPVTWSP